MHYNLPPVIGCNASSARCVTLLHITARVFLSAAATKAVSHFPNFTVKSSNRYAAAGLRSALSAKVLFSQSRDSCAVP